MWSACLLPDCPYHYVENADSATNVFDKRRAADNFAIMSSTREFYERNGMPLASFYRYQKFALYGYLIRDVLAVHRGGAADSELIVRFRRYISPHVLLAVSCGGRHPRAARGRTHCMISIAMATYNGEKYLREQLDSIQ